MQLRSLRQLTLGSYILALVPLAALLWQSQSALNDMSTMTAQETQFAITSVSMMGTLEREGSTWAIVRSPDSIIHRIGVGNYIGKNHGKIIGISEDRIELKEIVPDGQGGWSERDASLALLE